MRVMRFLALGLLLASVVFAAATYASLPEVVPTRLNLAGEPVEHARRSPMMWFMLPGLNVAMAAVFLGIGAALPRRPQLFNFPDKARLLALPPAYQAPVIDVMRMVLDVALVGVLLTMLSVQLLIWRIAMGHDAGALKLAPFAGLLLAPVLLLLVTRVQEATEQAEKRYRAEHPEAR